MPLPLEPLWRALNSDRHAHEIGVLKSLRTVSDLDTLMKRGGWLGPESTGPRLKLIRHHRSTWILVEYVDGWSTRIAQAEWLS